MRGAASGTVFANYRVEESFSGGGVMTSRRFYILFITLLTVLGLAMSGLGQGKHGGGRGNGNGKGNGGGDNGRGHGQEMRQARQQGGDRGNGNGNGHQRGNTDGAQRQLWQQQR